MGADLPLLPYSAGAVDVAITAGFAGTNAFALEGPISLSGQPSPHTINVLISPGRRFAELLPDAVTMTRDLLEAGKKEAAPRGRNRRGTGLPLTGKGDILPLEGIGVSGASLWGIAWGMTFKATKKELRNRP